MHLKLGLLCFAVVTTAVPASASAGTRALDECRLVTAAEATRILGVRVKLMRGGSESCFLNFRLERLRGVVLTVVPDVAGTESGFYRVRREMRRPPGGVVARRTYKDVRIGGDEAFQVEEVHASGGVKSIARIIWIHHSRTTFRISTGYQLGWKPITFVQLRAIALTAMKRF
jgi:hypothetical protein